MAIGWLVKLCFVHAFYRNAPMILQFQDRDEHCWIMCQRMCWRMSFFTIIVVWLVKNWWHVTLVTNMVVLLVKWQWLFKIVTHTVVLLVRLWRSSRIVMNMLVVLGDIWSKLCWADMNSFPLLSLNKKLQQCIALITLIIIYNIYYIYILCRHICCQFYSEIVQCWRMTIR